ncbi:hypothetical protein [Eubacterium sp.]|uniref:hypothetical protein n=2 Tax=Eubacterium TaxID=1730 RepID=UPI0025C1A5FF|nr:hypothetical protein [Eubacterium sp.]MCI7801469.1 hypothetical protein [Eubacterium sp.]
MKKSFSKTIAVLLAVLMVVCSLPMTVFAAGESRSNVQLQFGTYFASGADTHQTYVDENYSGFGDSGLNTAKLDYNKATGTITEASSGHTYGVGDFFTVSVLLENTSSLAASQVGIKYSDNIVPAAVGENQDGLTALLPATEVTSPTDGFAPNEAITGQSGNAIYNTASSTVGEISYIDADKNTMWANFAVQDGTDAVNLTAPKTVGVNTFTKTAVLATFGFKIVGDGAVTFSLADSKDVDSAYYVETIANGGKVEEYKTYTQTDYDGSTALDFMNNNENIESTKYTVKFVGADGTVISEAQYAEGATVTVPDLPKAEKISDTQHNTYAWDKEPALTATANATYTAVATAEDHNWNAGVKQDDGSTLYTCTVCGATKSETAHVHSWGEWTYNNDAVYVSSKNYKDGTATRRCDDCGKTETKTIEGTGLLRVNTVSVELAAAVVLRPGFAESRAAKFDETYCVIDYAKGKEQHYTLKDYKAVGTNRSYAFDQIAPKYFDQEVTITMYGVKDGIVCKGHSLNYSIKTYLYNQLKKNPSANMKKLLIETLYYGDADQTYNHMPNTLISDLTEEQKAIHTLDVPTYTKITHKIDNPTGNDIADWKTVALELSGAVYVKYKVEVPKTANLDDIDFHFVIDGVDTVVNHKADPDLFELTSAKNTANNAYFVTYKGMASHQYSVPINAYATGADGTQISKTLVFNAESYALSNAYKGDQTLALLVDQMLRYGRANIAYRANPNA